MILVTYIYIMTLNISGNTMQTTIKLLFTHFALKFSSHIENIKTMRLLCFRIISLLYWYVERLTETELMVLRMFKSK